MKRFALFFTLVLLALFIGCRGSVERAYDDAIIGSEGGLNDASAGSSGGEGSVNKKDDAEAGGPSPLTAPAQIGGSVVGLVGKGLVLRNNGVDDLTVDLEGAFLFPALVAPGQPYDVTVTNQPAGPTQTCTVGANGKGVAAGTDVLGIKVSCITAAYPVGGTVVGLAGAAGLVLQNNGGNDITVTADGTFAFPSVPSGANYNVVVKTSPAAHMCNVSGGTGTVVTAGVDSVVVNCGANTYTVGGTVTGLAGTLIIENKGTNARTLTANGSFAFSLPVASGADYTVAVKTNPVYPPSAQTCTVTNGSGTIGAANVTDVAISCTTNKYSVGGTVTGLIGTGLKLQNKSTDDKAITENEAFTFTTPLPSATSYSVTILTQPAGQTCGVTNGSGTVTSGAVTSVAITCALVIALEEHFDGVSAPALPAGWTQAPTSSVGTGLGVPNPWITVIDWGKSQSKPNSAFIEDVRTPHDVSLVSPAFNISSTTARLSFWNSVDSEFDLDGGVLEISIAGADWVDVVTAGGAFTAGGYNTTLKSDGTNTLGPRSAWSGRKTVVTTSNLPASAAGKSVRLRWRWGSNDGKSEEGWWIDDIIVTN